MPLSALLSIGTPNTGSGVNEASGAKVKFQLAPLVVREFGGKLLGAYLIDSKKMASKRAVDLVIVDGPPVNLGGREGTLYQIMDYARAGRALLPFWKQPRGA